MSGYGDGDYAQVSCDEWRTARKEHKCDGCKEKIRSGQKYRYVSILFDGSWTNYRRCERCEAIYAHLTERIRKEGDVDEFCHEALDCGHDYAERWEEEPPAEIAALAFWLPGDPLPTKAST